MNAAIIREVLTMKRRCISPEAIMRAWRLTPEQYARATDSTRPDVVECQADVDAHMRRDRMPAPTGISPTGGY